MSGGRPRCLQKPPDRVHDEGWTSPTAQAAGCCAGSSVPP